MEKRYDFEEMLESNLTIAQHNAAVRLANANPNCSAQIWAQMVAARTELNLFNEHLGAA